MRAMGLAALEHCQWLEAVVMSRGRLPRGVLGEEEEGQSLLSNKFLRMRVQQ